MPPRKAPAPRPEPPLSRRDFLKLSGLSLSALSMAPLGLARQRPGLQSLTPRLASLALPDFPDSERLGRVLPGKVDVKARPDAESETVNIYYEDSVVPWLKEMSGSFPFRLNQRWVETSGGYIWASHLQPVRNQPAQPLDALPVTNLGEGMWAEVCIPYVDLKLDNPPARSPALKERLRVGLAPRLYYSQLVWVDRVKEDEGLKWYRVNEKYGTYGDILWGEARAFKPLTEQEMAPISPEVEDKRVVVDLTYQTLSCYEGSREVYFARVSTGLYYDAEGNPTEKSSTPLGRMKIWRKLVSVHMSGGTTGGGWDLPGVAWTSLFSGNGVAIHSTFWHNNFGSPMSRGCVNAAPEDARWIFRWTQPQVAYDPGDMTVQWPGGTTVEVVER
jgi:hypothetical protein